MTARRRLALRLALLLAVVALYVFVQARYGVSTLQVRHWVDGLGPWAAPGFVASYVAVALVPIPKAPFSVAGGAVFGIAAGIPLVLVGAVGGATLAFAIARRLGRSPVRGMESDRARELDDRVAAHGFVAVLLARLFPVIPYTSVNYLFGLTGLRLPVFTVTTLVGVVPSISAYVVFGSLGATPVSWPFAVLGGVVILTSGLLGLRARHRRAQDETQAVSASDLGGDG
ncbi:TVP38/TMEM64 family protein [Nocardioides mangrovicus]|uniref:TVP38/TMEM64 family membrane protein n=1 Tax=Nocardioides mangrovicus TaxID=2478913 RepID=A0A3L8P467_9ACTN|nr:TVP38/TMEM64 family protein [Nocardioides mangrovicus]RLV49228.1 TVP38/TMEM64 family protein [Nocardioides mangrovicus]